jgi:hypothetical protein
MSKRKEMIDERTQEKRGESRIKQQEKKNIE